MFEETLTKLREAIKKSYPSHHQEFVFTNEEVKVYGSDPYTRLNISYPNGLKYVCIVPLIALLSEIGNVKFFEYHGPIVDECNGKKINEPANFRISIDIENRGFLIVYRV